MENVRHKFISKAEASRRLGIKRATVYDIIARGDLPIDERGRILRAPFEAMIAAVASVGGIPNNSTDRDHR